MELSPLSEEKTVGNPLRFHYGRDNRGWSKTVYSGDIYSAVFDSEPKRFEIEDIGFDEFIHVLGRHANSDRQGR